MEVYTQVPDKTTRDALKRLSALLGDDQGDAEATAKNAANDGAARTRRNRRRREPTAVHATKKAGYMIATGL
jgi:hypothetical protein